MSASAVSSVCVVMAISTPPGSKLIGPDERAEHDRDRRSQQSVALPVPAAQQPGHRNRDLEPPMARGAVLARGALLVVVRVRPQAVEAGGRVLRRGRGRRVVMVPALHAMPL